MLKTKQPFPGDGCGVLLSVAEREGDTVLTQRQNGPASVY